MTLPKSPRPVLRVLLVILVVLAGILPAVPGRAQLEAGVRAQVPPAIVQIGVVVMVSEAGETTEQTVVRGSGTVVSPDGVILTNHHVIDTTDLQRQLAAEQAQLERQGRTQRREVQADRYVILAGAPDEQATPRFEATLLEVDPELDFAVLRIDRDAAGNPLDQAVLELPYLQLGDSDRVELGEQVHVFGYPAVGSGLLTYTQGAVSSFDVDPAIAGRAWIKTDATVSGGSSGGGAVSDQGWLIGIPTQAGAIECRPGDTNGDGVVNELDIGCVPVGGTLNQLRPVNLAKPLLAPVCVVCTPTAGAAPALATLTIAVDGLAVPYSVDDEGTPLLLAMPDGGAMAFFSATVDAEPWREQRRLFVARFDPVRNRWLSAQPLPGGPIQFGPAAVVDSAGVVHLVFSQRPGDDPDDMATLLYARSYGQGLWEPPVPVAPDPNAGNQTLPALAIDESDRLYLAWKDQRGLSADDRILFPDASRIYFSEQRAGVWSAATELQVSGAYGPHAWLRLVVAGQRLIALWNVFDSGIDYIGWSERSLDGSKAWSDTEASTIVSSNESSLMTSSRARAVVGVPRRGEALFAGVPHRLDGAPLELQVLKSGTSEWELASSLIVHDTTATEQAIDRLSLVTGLDGTSYAVFEQGPQATREVTIIAHVAGTELPSPGAVVTAEDPGPQGHFSVAVGIDGALWILYADLDAGVGGGELRVRRWLPTTDTLPATVEELLPTEAEVPLPLTIGDGFWDPVALAQETPRPSPDPADLERRLTEEWLLTQAVLLRYDTATPARRWREVSIHEFAAVAGAEAALDHFLNERAAAGGLTEVSAAQYCLSGRGIERYVRGPATLTALPEGEELTLYLQWDHLLLRMTDVYELGSDGSSGARCPVVPIPMGARLVQAGQGLLPLMAALPTEAETRMIGDGGVARSRDELLRDGPDRPLDTWGWRGNVVQTYRAPETGLTMVEAEVIRLGGPSLAAAAVTRIANDRAAYGAGALAEMPPPPSLAGVGQARLLAGSAMTVGGEGQYEATVIIQSHELVFRVTAVAATEPPLTAALRVAGTMLAKRLPAGHNAESSPPTGQ